MNLIHPSSFWLLLVSWSAALWLQRLISGTGPCDLLLWPRGFPLSIVHTNFYAAQVSSYHWSRKQLLHKRNASLRPHRRLSPDRLSYYISLSRCPDCQTLSSLLSSNSQVDPLPPRRDSLRNSTAMMRDCLDRNCPRHLKTSFSAR